jgi:hypothetical protein
MNERVKKGLNEERGTFLLQEFNDTMFRIERLDEQHTTACAKHMVTEFRNIQENFGPLTNVSCDVKTELANILREEAKNCFDCDQGRGFGIVLLSLFLESATLPGDDAQYVHDYLSRFLDSPKPQPSPE